MKTFVKYARSSFMIAGLALAVFALAGGSVLAQSAQTDVEAATLLTNGQWFFQGKNWSNVRTFHPDGTFQGRKNGSWKIENGKVRLIFADHEDDLILPLDPKGTKGTDSQNLPLVAVQQPAAGPTPVPAPAPTAAPAEPPSISASGQSGQTEADINALFTSGTWHFQGKGWANDRVFHEDKTFTGGGDGSWHMADGVVVVITGGKQMKLNLPVDPKGTNGIGSTGFPVFIYRMGETPNAPQPPPGALASTPAVAANPKPVVVKESTPRPVVMKTPPPIVASTPRPNLPPNTSNPYGERRDPTTGIVPVTPQPGETATPVPALR